MEIPTAPTDLSDALFKKIATYVYDHAGINLTENKRELVRARIGKMIRQRRMRGYQEYYEWMIADETGEAVREVMNAVSTNLTSFFREPKHFDFLRSHLAPAWSAATGSGRGWSLRGWSAGCSTGEEIYTIAVVLREALPEWHRWEVKLLATDIDTTVLDHGRAGVYEARRVETVPQPILRRWFQRSADRNRYRVKEELRRLVHFKYLNLMNPWPLKRSFDFIFCRNVMIYFDRETQQMLIDRFYERLAPGGHLFIGHSEGLSGVQHRFQYVQPTVYRK